MSVPGQDSVSGAGLEQEDLVESCVFVVVEDILSPLHCLFWLRSWLVGQGRHCGVYFVVFALSSTISPHAPPHKWRKWLGYDFWSCEKYTKQEKTKAFPTMFLEGISVDFLWGPSSVMILSMTNSRQAVRPLMWTEKRSSTSQTEPWMHDSVSDLLFCCSGCYFWTWSFLAYRAMNNSCWWLSETKELAWKFAGLSAWYLR